MWDDEIQTAIRAIRDAHAAAFNYDVAAIVRDTQAREKELAKAGWRFAPPPPARGPVPDEPAPEPRTQPAA